MTAAAHAVLPAGVRVVHATGGRVRLRVAGLGQDAHLQALLANRLRECPQVRRFRINPACDSVVIEYRGAAPDLGALVERGSGRAASAPDRKAAPGEQPQQALAWAALSLLLSALPSARVLAQLSLIASGLPILRRAVRVIARERRLNVDFLDAMALGTTLARRQSATGALMAGLVHLGDWVRDHTARRSRRHLRQFLDLGALQARLIAAGGEVAPVPAARLQRGQRALVLAGDLVPADGVVTEGTAAVDQRQMTGESVPATCTPGGRVYAGSNLLEGSLVVEVTAAGARTEAARLMQLVESAPLGDTRVQNYAERFADKLVAPVFGLNVALFAVTGNVDRFVSLSIVDYGTGIRVAAPTSVLASMARAAREGILIKGGRQLEQLAHLRSVAFDKTGTLTRGVLTVQSVRCFARGMTPHALVRLAASAEAHLKHPIARALVARAAQADPRTLAPCEDTDYSIGLGVTGSVEGRRVHVGSERYLRGAGIGSARARSVIAATERRGHAALLIAVDGELAGAIAFSDELRPDAPAVLGRLRARGVRDIVMLTGDREAVARHTARAAGIDQYHAEVLPQDKARIVAELRRRGGPVAMVGDGVNDAAALARADIGISVHGGADIARDAADVVLLHDSLAALPRAIDLARDALALVSQNFGIVAAANTVALGLALPRGLLSPLACTVLSNGSAMVAALNSMRPLVEG